MCWWAALFGLVAGSALALLALSLCVASKDDG
jgi:hypothetical protein